MANQYKPVNIDEANLMRDFWFQNQRNMSAVARKFKRSLKAVRGACAKYNWRELAQDLDEQKRDALVQEAIKQEVSDFQIIKSAVNRVAHDLLCKKSWPAKWSDLVQLMRLKLELSGTLSGDKGDNIVNVVTNDGSNAQLVELLAAIERAISANHSRF